mmetsp:Transcript_29281/g.60000  ORF Transcript_29281/g.60000 Transcript_29281/m.60000 type:complete len:199 (-) Transcript_29281:347-943(-)|eukprot:CAMPEP_0119544328 /NCGR_PEP_ID=MMETSP1344-20130328/54663_1 /TAXON_ID=236787 /ORGANISM="Florenciella parvula, Strain CCMP2471" /LENGTH=198 /DNA_ID=CAMNT_0007588815 /DNA_START=66 /DNA_END=662 /DNA_ORIENTATION=+
MAAAMDACTEPEIAPQPFYLNLVVVDSSAAVESKVEEKVGKGMFGLKQKAAVAMAKAVVSDEKVAGKLGEKLSEVVPSAVHEMGIELNVEQKFQKGPLVVLRVQVTSIDAISLLTSVKGEEFASTFATMVQCFETLGIEQGLSTVKEQVNTKVTEALMEKLSEILPQKLADNQIEATCVAMSSQDQAEYFYEQVNAMG